MAQGTFIVNEIMDVEMIQEIEMILNSFEGVERVLIDIEDREVKMEFDEKIITKEEIISALKTLGYYI